jgi:hypothetical protein
MRGGWHEEGLDVFTPVSEGESQYRQKEKTDIDH